MRRGAVMAAITRPMKGQPFDSDFARYPYLATPKIDGIRFLMVNDSAVSSSFKKIRNRFIWNRLSKLLPNGLDGEITVGSTFNETSSAVMAYEGKPFFTAWIFDYVNPERKNILSYAERIEELRSLELEDLNEHSEKIGGRFKILSSPHLVSNYEDVEFYRDLYIGKGFEGLILRSPKGTYKMGKATHRENLLLKIKEFVDEEAVVIGFKELMRNNNAQEIDKFGNMKRSKKSENLVPGNTLGSLIVKRDGLTFDVGSGFDDSTRKYIWDNQEEFLGQLCKYKYMKFGVKDAPRHPIFQGIRHPDDMTEEVP